MIYNLEKDQMLYVLENKALTKIMTCYRVDIAPEKSWFDFRQVQEISSSKRRNWL
jgi:hypothetical protein